MGNGTWIPLRPKATAGQVAQDEQDGKARWGAPIRNWGERSGLWGCKGFTNFVFFVPFVAIFPISYCRMHQSKRCSV